MPTAPSLLVGAIRNAAKMFTGGGSGLYEQTQLTEQQRARSMVLQDTRRSIDQFTWRKLLAYGRQLYANCGEVRGPVIERAVLANSGGWEPRCIGKHTPKAVRAKYEEWLWNWMKVSNLRGQPFDFFTDMYLDSIAIDRDGEAPFLMTVNRSGDPRIQTVANHRIYSHFNVFTVMDACPYRGMRFNNGVVYDDQSTPVAYFVLEESLQFSQSIKGKWIPAKSLSVPYNPDWCDQGRGVTAYAHAIRRIFDIDDIHAYLLIGVKRDAALPIIRKSLLGGKQNVGKDFISNSTSSGGTAVSLEETMGGMLWDVTVDSKSDIVVPSSTRPSPNVPEYMESIWVGAYQGLNWPYEYSRISKEARGANIRVTTEKVNHSVRCQHRTLRKNAARKCGYALGFAVNRGELPHGEWWEIDFPMPPEMTADKYREFQEARENYKLGMDTMQDIFARAGRNIEDVRNQRDADMEDKYDRVKALAQKYPELSFKEHLDYYEQRSANPSSNNGGGAEDDDSDGDTEGKPTKKKPSKRNDD